MAGNNAFVLMATGGGMAQSVDPTQPRQTWTLIETLIPFE
jgi:hypothetical protein